MSATVDPLAFVCEHGRVPRPVYTDFLARLYAEHGLVVVPASLNICAEQHNVGTPGTLGCSTLHAAVIANPNERGASMATATKTRSTRKTAAAKAGTSRAKTTAKATGKGKTTPTKADGPSKRELLAAQNAENTERMLELREAGQSWAQIAEELKITPGKAQYLMMCHLVAEGEVPAITARNEAELVKKIIAARAKADEYSSWGWLSARTSTPENSVKKMVEEAGSYTPRAENIAAIRAERNGTTKKGNAPAKGKPAVTKTAAKTGTTRSAKATAAKKRAARAAGKAKTS